MQSQKMKQICLTPFFKVSALFPAVSKEINLLRKKLQVIKSILHTSTSDCTYSKASTLEH